MNAFFSSAHLLRYFLGFALSILFLLSATFALPLGAVCETDNCDTGLVCKNSNGQRVPPGAGPGTCVLNCDYDNFCDNGEDVQFCTDCHCGNGTCEPNAPRIENSTNCAEDCFCGNGTVEAGENNCNCPADVPAITCGDGCCKPGETQQSCAADCGAPPLCGNSQVNPGETFCNCPIDVQNTSCGDGCCIFDQGENPDSCYQDCGSCGDGQCDAPETVGSCPADCHACGDGVCSPPWENGNNCIDCQTPSCTISGPSVCRNNTYTFDCNYYYADGPMSMSNSYPNQTSQGDSLTVTFGSTAQGVTTLSCFDNGTPLCTTSRSIGYCGDGSTNCGEQCDYAGGFSSACNATTCTWKSCSQNSDCGGGTMFVCSDGFCSTSVCGDGIKSFGEECEVNSDCAMYGNGFTCEGCSCSNPGGGGNTPPVCGNYIKETGEQCDDGDLAEPGQGGTAIEMDTCNGATCAKVNVCGDGIVGAGEQCDNAGKCTRYPANQYPPLTGDQYCNEESDCNFASNAVCAPRGGDGCSVTCQIESGWICGDGITITAAGEACDDGNMVNGDGCDNNCKATACGNGIVTSGPVGVNEECDDGNVTNGDGCSSTCVGAFCGDGILQEKGANGVTGGGDDEVCDDGNEVNGDGCTADCSYCGLHCSDCSVKLPNLDIFFVVDTSASMAEPVAHMGCGDGDCKLIDAKTAIQMFVNALNPAEDRVALIEFNSTATVKYPLASNTGFSQMLSAVNALQHTGLTNMGAAMNTLATLAGGYTYNGRVPVVIFLGDGQPTLPSPTPDPVTFTETQAAAFHAAFPDFKVYSIGLDLVSLSPTNQVIALDLLKNHIASTPADYYNGAPGGKGAVCGGGKGTDAGTLFGGGGLGVSTIIGGAGLAETYGQIRDQMCQCGIAAPTPVCGGGKPSSFYTAGGGGLQGSPKGGFCSGKPSLSCTTNLNCGSFGPCVTSNNLCGGWERYECPSGSTCEGCGDGVIQAGEQCDFGTANGSAGVGCDTFCKLTTYCGDGVVQDCEVCDDGNYESGDGCSPWCTKETVVCGDDVINLCGVLTGAYLANGNEDGYCAGDTSVLCNDKGLACPGSIGPCLEATYCNVGDQGTCLHDSSVSCTSNFDCIDNKTGISVCVGLALAQIPDPSLGGPTDLKQICGGGSEFCDDGNQVGGDGCPANCQSTCGDGIVEGPEQCDDGNLVNTDACTNICAVAVCGDSIVRTGLEQCDDGKDGDADDGCTDQCTTGVCDPTTQYASGAIPGWSCPVDWVLQGCPGAYLCVRKTITPIVCTECGDEIKQPTEECDPTDPNDPYRLVCSPSCLLLSNSCGDGIVFTGASTGFVRNWISTGATTTRPMLAFSRVITQGQGGMSYILESGAGAGSAFGKTMTLINDIDGDGFQELAVGAPGHNVAGVTNHGQIISLSFDTGGKVDTLREYYSGTTISGGTDLWMPNYLEAITDIENSIFGPGAFSPHKEFIFSSLKQGFTDRLLALFVGKFPVFSGPNMGSVILNSYTTNQIRDLATVGDIDNNGVDDIIALVSSTTDPMEFEIEVTLLRTQPGLYLSNQRITGLGFTGPGQGKISPLGDTNGDGNEDVLVSWYNEKTEQMIIKRLLLNTNGSLQSQSTIQTVTFGKATFGYAIYGPDIDEDGVNDIVRIRGKEAPYMLDGVVLFMNANRTIKASQLVDFGASKAQGDAQFYPNEALFLPDFDADSDETIAIGSPKSFDYKGAIYTYELQAPYGHELTGGGNIEECDSGSYCDDLVTRCEDNPAICPGGPSRCQPRYLNGCTPFCQLGCGDGQLDQNGLDGVPNTSDDEECDDGDGDNYDGCTNECKRPYCGDTILTLNSNRTGQNGEYPNGYFEQCDPTSTGLNYGNCLPDCTLTGGINAVCNFSFASSVAYNAETVDELLDAVAATSETLCFPEIGNVLQSLTGLVDPITGITTGWSRTCQGQLSGQSTQCVLPRWACGDGILDVWSTTQGEECDDGNKDNNDGCNAECEWEDPLIAPLNQCTAGSYPQVEVGEYLPVWWVGERSESVGPVGGACDVTTTANMILRNSIMCQVDVQRGDPVNGKVTVATVSVPCATKANAGGGLIAGAISDFASGISVDETLGTFLFNSGQVYSWVNYGGNPLYGQYQLGVKTIDMEYCALRRTSSQGTVTGEVTELSDFENCTNNLDDNGNGLIDCADTVLCGNFALHPHCDPNWIGQGGGGGPVQPENTLITCSDNIDNDNDGNKDCADTGCVTFANCDPGRDVKPENCRTPDDEDGDGLGGCDDPSCSDVPYCLSNQIGSIEGTAGYCADGIDNDNDGFTDCNDPNCLNLVTECKIFNGNQCNDGLNNEPYFTGGQWGYSDGSYQADQIAGSNVLDDRDPQCFRGGGAFYSKEVDCYDGQNGNNISLVDCQDPTCQFFSVCGVYPFNQPYGSRNQQPLSESYRCGDGIDNDGDGWVDCADIECQDKPILCLGVPPSGGQGVVEICDDIVDQNNDGFVNCSAGNCSTHESCTVGWNENCRDEDAAGNPIDNDGDGLANEFDPECYQFFGEGHQVPQALGSRTTGDVTYTATGAMCEAGFSVSKGYFVQQGFTFSEQANTGLNTANFTSIEGVSLVAEGTAIDESLNQLATYQGAGKQYLFSGFIETWTTKAVNPIYPNGSLSNAVKFLKVPTAHIYFRDGTSGTLVLDEDLRNRILSAGGVDTDEYNSTAYTIVLPEAGNNLVFQGTVRGNGMYISQGNIKFSSSADLGCDGSDVVEGLFVAGGSFETDTIGNRSLNQDKWCKGGNLQIKGTLLGMNAGAQLAPLRRSVLNAWSSGNLLFDDSKVFQAKELFETCYLPSLVFKVFGGYETWANGPLVGCNINTFNSKKPISLTYMKSNVLDGLDLYLQEVEAYMSSECVIGQPCTYQIVEKFINTLPNKPITNNDPNFTAQSIQFLREATYGGQFTWNISVAAMQYIDSRGKVLPLRMVPNPAGGTHTVDLMNPLKRRQMLDYLSKYVEPIKQQFLSFPSRDMQSIVFNDIGVSAQVSYTAPSTLVGKLYSIFGAGFLTYLDNLSALRCEGELLKTLGGPPKSGNFNKFICSADMVWLRTNRNDYLEESVSRGDDIIEGSSVVILSNPTTWIDLPPGAKDFLNSLVVLPK